ncbi:unnamed protein product [Vicia faba]|uniref:Uncharacterized protein n=1 Tax=Vicia faba TaxID=3906 RepID=A0AAV0YTP1_VICFA|nr:unnamed protein product [Vicia faba]
MRNIESVPRTSNNFSIHHYHICSLSRERAETDESLCAPPPTNITDVVPTATPQLPIINTSHHPIPPRFPPTLRPRYSVALPLTGNHHILYVFSCCVYSYVWFVIALLNFCFLFEWRWIQTSMTRSGPTAFFILFYLFFVWFNLIYFFIYLGT